MCGCVCVMETLYYHFCCHCLHFGATPREPLGLPWGKTQSPDQLFPIIPQVPRSSRPLSHIPVAPDMQLENRFSMNFLQWLGLFNFPQQYLGFGLQQTAWPMHNKASVSSSSRRASTVGKEVLSVLKGYISANHSAMLIIGDSIIRHVRVYAPILPLFGGLLYLTLLIKSDMI